jgi:hypothetical protein
MQPLETGSDSATDALLRDDLENNLTVTDGQQSSYSGRKVVVASGISLVTGIALISISNFIGEPFREPKDLLNPMSALGTSIWVTGEFLVFLPLCYLFRRYVYPNMPCISRGNTQILNTN